MSSNNTNEEEFLIFESSMNGDVNDEFEIVESSFSFANKEFSRHMKDEMHYYGINVDTLSKSTFISKFRLGALVNGNAEFEPHEINIIRKRLHF